MALFTALKIHKQMYPATYCFKDEVDGTSGTDIGFVDTAVLYNGACEIISDWQSHKKVLRLQDDVTGGEDPSISHNETQATAGTREFWVGTNDVTESWQFIFYEVGLDSIVRLRFHGSALDYYDNGDIWQEVQAITNDKLYHIKVVWRADNTFDLYVDGIKQVDNQITNNNMVSGIDRVYFNAYGDSEDYLYLDAYGDPDNDANYNVGDNIHWRNYKESTDSFEGDDVGTQGTSITWVDTVDTAASVEIVQEFNEHKKILRQSYTSAAGGYDYSEHSCASTSKTGWFECWLKVSDITYDNYILLPDVGEGVIIELGIGIQRFEYKANGGAWTAVPNAPTPVNDTWYHIYIQWYDAANDNFDLWIDNIQYLDGVQTLTNMGAGIYGIRFVGYSATGMYIDAPTSSLDSDERADNRTFGYHLQSYDDITSNIEKCFVTDLGYDGSTALITDDTTLTLSELHLIQLYDENSDLRFEGNIISVNNPSIRNQYPLISLNNDELNEENSYTASAPEDVDASLHAIHTNIGQVDGRLIYYTEDDPAGNLTPNFKNKPKKMGIRWFAIHSGKIATIKPNGVFFLDDDRNPVAGAATITESSGEILFPPRIVAIKHQINYVEVRGGIDPDTGTPFSGISEDTTTQADGTGIKRYYKRFRDLQSDIDCENRAIAIRTGAGFSPNIITVELAGIYAIRGEIINFGYSPLSFSAVDCYVESGPFNLVQGKVLYRLNTGIFDSVAMNTPGYTMADETADDIAAEIYETDITTIDLNLWSFDGTMSTHGWLLSNGDHIGANIYTSSKIDTTRNMTFTFIWYSVADLTIDGELTLVKTPCDGITAGTTIEDAINYDITFGAQLRKIDTTLTVDKADIDGDCLYDLFWENVDANSIVISSIQVEYYIKRSV